MGRYSIHQVSELFGISADAIRLYEKEGLVTPLRDKKNGYRYYEIDQIQRIMGISLYRQIGVGITEIERLFRISSLEEISNEFQKLVEDNEEQVEALQKKIEKLKFMKQHMDALREGVGTYTRKVLPKCYIITQSESVKIEYEMMRDMINQPAFSFGNVCYHIRCEEKGKGRPDSLQFIIREPMMAVSPLNERKSEFLVQEEAECLYTVMPVRQLENLEWNLKGLYQYASENGIVCGREAYCFYVFSLMNEVELEDYFEIYVQIVK